MARLYSRKKGKSGSTKPHRTESPKWANQSKDEIEKLVVELAKGGKDSSEIGIILRDQHGIPDVKLVIGTDISGIMEKNNIAPKFPRDLTDLLKHALRIKKHFDMNKMDMDAKRGLQLTESKIRRLTKYYKRTGKVAENWNYSLEQAKLIVG